MAHSALCACVGRAQVRGVTGNTSSAVAADPSPAALVQRTGLNQLECLLFLLAKPMGHISYQNVSGEQRCRRKRELGGGARGQLGGCLLGAPKPQAAKPCALALLLFWNSLRFLSSHYDCNCCSSPAPSLFCGSYVLICVMDLK